VSSELPAKVNATEKINCDYCRASQDKTGAGFSVEAQHLENQDAADELGIRLSETYTDNDRSAWSGVERPAYVRLLADIEAGKIGTLIIWHANRLHRATEEVNAFIRLARAHSLRLYSTTKGGYYNLDKASGRKELRDDTSEAEYESEHRGERVALARKRQARNGDFGGGQRPYGWGVDTGRVRSVCMNPKAPTLERVYEDRPVLDMTRHNDEEAAEIRAWAKALLAGVSMRQLLADLKRRGVPTTNQKDGRTIRRNGQVIEQSGWCSTTIQSIVTHPRTSGHMVYRGEIIRRNALPEILPEDTRQALIALFASHHRTNAGSVPTWLGSLIYQCGQCDGLPVMVVTKNPRKVPIYRCRDIAHNLHPAIEVDRFVETVLIERLSRADVKDLLPQHADIDLVALREKLRILEGRKQEAAQSYALGAIDKAQLETITATADGLINEIRATICSASQHSPLAAFAASDDAAETWHSLSLGHKREIVRLLADVVLVPVGRGKRSVPIQDRVSIKPKGAK
ncbi:recombinase family protein, partial [Nonomuraea sp. RK-328]|nr:recombinase family protein [Nonomuraea sp. RK-328]